MKPDPLENRLTQLRPSPLPPEWREVILARANASVAPQSNQRGWDISRWIQELLWPSPKIWAGFACAWMMIFFLSRGLNREHPPQLATPVATLRSADPVLALLAEQRRWRLELLGLTDVSAEAEKSRSRPGRPSGRRGQLTQLEVPC